MQYKTDNNYILTQYKTDKNLSKRIQIHQYNTNKYKWFNWVYDKMDVENGMKILEVGCGNGLLWFENTGVLPDDVEIILSDISQGMIDKAKTKINNKNFKFEVFDSNKIPYNDKYFDIIIANHMLYHVKNISSTMSEIKRTLKDDGRLFASTNGKKNMNELEKWKNKFSINVDYNPGKLYKNFGIENGKSILTKHFKKIKFIEYIDGLEISDINSIINYYESLRKSDQKTDYTAFISYLENKIKKDKLIKITKKIGMFIASK
jgi:ubiquinone/menaquinone biosynthesis C-methylase UbiE